MVVEWSTARVAQVAAINPEAIGRDWPHSHMSYIDISSVGVGQMEEPPQRLSIAEAPSRAKRIIRKGDTVISTVRPNRRSMFFASNPGENWVVSTGFAVLRPNTTQIDPRYLYACVFNQTFTEYLIGREKGAAYPAVSPEDIGNAEIALPPLDEQRAIAHILGTLDDKIELNRRMNKTLEAIARAMFKSWFVDFDPVRARKSGELPESICQRLGLTPDLLALFPDRLVDSELGEIPEGWKVHSFVDGVDVIGGGTPKTSVPEYWDGEIPWFSVVDAPSGSEVWVVDTEKKITKEGIEHSSTKILPIGTTIISARGTVGKIALVGVPMGMNQSCYGLRGKVGTGLFNYFATQQLVSTLQQRTHGSVFDTITRATLEGVDTVTPPTKIVAGFEELIGPCMQTIRTNILQSRTLGILRDSLLPKLLSGELHVPNIEGATL